jgi:predicted transcriptional regulator
MTKRNTEHTSATGIRLPDSLLERLRVAADERDVSMNWLAVRAIRDYLDRLIPIDEFKLTR